MNKTFSLDISAIRERARQHMRDGAVTDGYKADRETVIQILNEALATELLCVMRYKSHYHMATGLQAHVAAAEFLEHANQEQDHSDQIAERIVQLGGEPDYNPKGLSSRSHSEFGAAQDLREMLTDNLVAERIAIETYTEIIRFLGDDDPTTRRTMESVLAVEEEHAQDMLELLENLPS